LIFPSAHRKLMLRLRGCSKDGLMLHTPGRDASAGEGARQARTSATGVRLCPSVVTPQPMSENVRNRQIE
jgi:hypothetical protein